MLLDHYDNCASGGTMDTTAVLAAILPRASTMSRPSRSATPRRCSRRSPPGIGAEVALAIGGKIDDAGDPRRGRPLRGDRHGQDNLARPLPQQGADGAGVQMDMGPSVVLDTGKVEIALISRHVEPNDINCLLLARHRPDAEAYRDAEKPHPLARRPRGDGEGRRRMRRNRRLHIGLQPAQPSTTCAARSTRSICRTADAAP